VAVTGLMALPVKESYKRRDDDERKVAGEGVSVQDEVDVFIFAQPYFSSGLMNCAMFVTVAVTGLMALPVKESYKRRDDDERKAAGEGVSVQDEVDLAGEKGGDEEEEPSGNGIGRKSHYKARYINGGSVEEL